MGLLAFYSFKVSNFISKPNTDYCITNQMFNVITNDVHHAFIDRLMQSAFISNVFGTNNVLPILIMCCITACPGFTGRPFHTLFSA